MREKIVAAFLSAEDVLHTARGLSFDSGSMLAVSTPFFEDEKTDELSEALQWAEHERAMRERKQYLDEMMLTGAERIRAQCGELANHTRGIHDLMEFSYAELGPCDYPPNNHWCFADVIWLGYGMARWAGSVRLLGIHERSHVIGSAEHQKFEQEREACPYSESFVNRIRGRMQLEKSRLLRDHTETPAKQPESKAVTAAPEQVSSTKPTSKRKRNTPIEKNTEQILLDFLCIWHGVDTDNFKSDAVGLREFVRWLATQETEDTPTSRTTVERFFESVFDGWPKYKQLCKANSIEVTLKLKTGRMTQSGLQQLYEDAIDSRTRAEA